MTITVTSVTSTNFSSDATAHAVNMPAATLANELLLTLFAVDGQPTITTPAGWTLLLEDREMGVGDLVTAIYGKIASGAEGGTSVDFVTSATERATAQVYRITQWAGAFTSVACGGGSIHSHAMLSPFGGGTNLWLNIHAKSSAQAWAATPANYASETQSDSGSTTGGAQLVTAYRTDQTAAYETALGWSPAPASEISASQHLLMVIASGTAGVPGIGGGGGAPPGAYRAPGGKRTGYGYGYGAGDDD